MPQTTEIRIQKQALKFASSHMTVFPDGTKEAIHGHQYLPTVTLRVRDASFKKMIAFSEVKTAMKKLAQLWDEKLLLATENPYFKVVKKTKTSIEFDLCKKRYVIPADEVVLLKIDNITCEALAHAYFQFLEMEWDGLRDKNILSVSVYIEESPGQGAAYIYERD
jgi:6-pyruvoyltetrahydropterin/6-carboxytetrahydropterin synthase